MKKIEKKSHNAEKKLKRRTLWEFSTIILLQNSRKFGGGHFGGKKLKEVAQCRKKSEEGTLWSRPVLYVRRENFLVQFFGQAGTIWRLLKILKNFW